MYNYDNYSNLNQNILNCGLSIYPGSLTFNLKFNVQHYIRIVEGHIYYEIIENNIIRECCKT